MDPDKYILQIKNGLDKKPSILIRCRVHAGAKKTGIKEILTADKDEILKIDIATAPEKGRANKELQGFLKEFFNASSAEVISGGNSNNKIIKLCK